METEKIENLNEKKEEFKQTLADMLSTIEKEEEHLKELQEKFKKQRKEIRKWLSWMG
jgi:hypothetical protein